MFAQVLGGLHAQHLEQRVLHDAHGKTRGDVGHVRAVFLRLLDGAVHEDRAAAAQIDRVAGEQAEFREIRDGITQRSCERLDKAAAAGAAGFVQYDGIDGIVADGQTFHVLPADVHDKVHVRIEEPRGAVVRHGLHETAVQMERPLDQFLAVTGDRGTGDGHAGIRLRVDIAQLLAHHVHRISFIVTVIGIQDRAFRIDQHEFRRRAAAVDAQIRLALITGKFSRRHLRPAVTLQKFLILRFVFEQRLGVFRLCGGACRVLQRGQPFFVGIARLLARTVEGGAQRDGKAAVFGEHGVFVRQFQRLLETVAQTPAVIQRSA